MSDIKLGTLTSFDNGHKQNIDYCKELGVNYCSASVGIGQIKSLNLERKQI